jgi:hypothetical protein
LELYLLCPIDVLPLLSFSLSISLCFSNQKDLSQHLLLKSFLLFWVYFCLAQK